MTKAQTKQLTAASKRAQNDAALARAAAINAALTVRDKAAPVVEAVGHQAKRAGVYAGAFIRTLIGK